MTVIYRLFPEKCFELGTFFKMLDENWEQNVIFRSDCIKIDFYAYFFQILMQIRDVSKVPYLKLFDLGSNRGLCPLFRVFTVFQFDLPDKIRISSCRAVTFTFWRAKIYLNFFSGISCWNEPLQSLFQVKLSGHNCNFKYRENSNKGLLQL